MAKPYERGEMVPNLRPLRRRTGLSQRQLAERAGITPITIQRLEAGRKGDPLTLDRLSAALAKELGKRITRRTLAATPVSQTNRRAWGQAAPNLRPLRERTALTKRELAAKAGVSVDTVRRLEAGRTGDPEMLKALAAALSKELGERITWSMLLPSSSSQG